MERLSDEIRRVRLKRAEIARAEGVAVTADNFSRVYAARYTTSGELSDLAIKLMKRGSTRRSRAAMRLSEDDMVLSNEHYWKAILLQSQETRMRLGREESRARQGRALATRREDGEADIISLDEARSVRRGAVPAPEKI